MKKSLGALGSAVLYHHVCYVTASAQLLAYRGFAGAGDFLDKIISLTYCPYLFGDDLPAGPTHRRHRCTRGVISESALRRDFSLSNRLGTVPIGTAGRRT